MIARDEGRLDDAVRLLAEAYAIHADHADIREISWDLLESAGSGNEALDYAVAELAPDA